MLNSLQRTFIIHYIVNIAGTLHLCFKFLILFQEKYCYCRQMELSKSEEGPDGQCDIPCNGNKQEMCGGVHSSSQLISVAEICNYTIIYAMLEMKIYNI